MFEELARIIGDLLVLQQKVNVLVAETRSVKAFEIPVVIMTEDEHIRMQEVCRQVEENATWILKDWDECKEAFDDCVDAIRALGLIPNVIYRVALESDVYSVRDSPASGMLSIYPSTRESNLVMDLKEALNQNILEGFTVTK